MVGQTGAPESTRACGVDSRVPIHTYYFMHCPHYPGALAPFENVINVFTSVSCV